MTARSCLAPGVICAISGLCVALGMMVSLKLTKVHNSVHDVLYRFDVMHYYEIVRDGYSYAPGNRSMVAFFPVYPGSAWVLQQATGLTPMLSLLVASSLYLCATFFVLAAYLRHRGHADIGQVDNTKWVNEYGLLSFAFFPTTLFFRIPYSESTFLLFALMSFYGMAKRWPLLLIALTVGVTTATRAVGIAMLLPFALHLYRLKNVGGVARCITWTPVACWGLLAYMLYQYLTFGDALAFAKTQSYWSIRPPTVWWDKLLSLASLEPFWGMCIPNTHYAQTFQELSIFHLNFMNPFYFGGTAFLVSLGAWKKWLTREEVGVSILLLLIPYATKGYEWGLMSHGRFATVVFPAYIVMGHLLARIPQPIAISLLGLSAFLLGAYAALFASGHGFY